MCINCVEAAFPERGKTCLDGGSYLLNFKGCFECGKREMVQVVEKKYKSDGEDKETVKYSHQCFCGHYIAGHKYKFEVTTSFEQEYEMNCLLCGVGENTVEAFQPKQCDNL
ncbi:protein Churchill [Hydra vulgaris]|uniref:Protein Churchill n=1 Tax=Hydra vulgaris TaxID=6087 RepID=A0ABM4CNX0_HYDVU